MVLRTSQRGADALGAAGQVRYPCEVVAALPGEVHCITSPADSADYGSPLQVPTMPARPVHLSRLADPSNLLFEESPPSPAGLNGAIGSHRV